MIPSRVCLFLSALFSSHNVLKVHPYSGKWQDFFFLIPNHIQCCVYILQLLYPFIHWRTFKLLPCLDIVNNAALNIVLQRFLQYYVSLSFVYISEARFLGHMVVLFLIFWGISILFSYSDCIDLCSHQQCESYHFFYILTKLVISCLFW